MSDGRAEAGRKEEEESGEELKDSRKGEKRNEAKGGKDAARIK